MLRAANIVVLAVLYSASLASGEVSNLSDSDIGRVSVDSQHDSVRGGGQSSVAIRFELKRGWHFYASEKTAPGQMNLKIVPVANDYITFSRAVFPKSRERYPDSA